MITVLEKLKDITDGGIEAFVFGMLDNIQSGDVKISLYSDNPVKSQKYLKKIDTDSISHHSPSRDYTEIRLKPLRMLLKWNDFLRFIKKNQFDVVHIHLNRPYDMAYICAARLGGAKRLICHSHFAKRRDTGLLENALDPVFELLFGFCADDYIACSKTAAEYMFPKKIINAGKFNLLKNGIDIRKYSFDVKVRAAVRQRLGLKDKFVIGNVGRLALQKNHTFLLDVFSSLHGKYPNSVLLIIGAGELEDDIRQKAYKLGLKKSVLFLGAVSAEEYYSAMDCFAFPSLFEGFGIAAVEAQAAGLKTLCSTAVPPEVRITDLVDFLPLENGAEAWADRLLEYNDGYIRRNTSDEIRAAGYDIGNTAETLKEIYIGSK